MGDHRLPARRARRTGAANAYGLTFKSEESGYLVGYLAAEMAKAKIGPKGKSSGKLVLSAVGGKKIPSVDNWIAGYRAGAKAVDKRFKVLIDYSGDFPPSAAPKCKEIALKHISQGAQAVFQVAGGCGLGALQAAKQKRVWGIGVDTDQAYLGSHILTSGVKRVDTAVYTFYALAKAGKLGAGKDLVFNLKNKGQDVGKISQARPEGVRHEDERPEGAHHQGQDQASGGALGSTVRLEGGASCAPFVMSRRRIARDGRRPARPGAARHNEALSGDRRERSNRPRPPPWRGARAPR